MESQAQEITVLKLMMWNRSKIEHFGVLFTSHFDKITLVSFNLTLLAQIDTGALQQHMRFSSLLQCKTA